MDTDSPSHQQAPSRHTENRHVAPGKTCMHFQTYGLTCDEYDRLKERAAGRCEICQTPEPETVRGALVIDHFSGGGAWFVRGLLCDKCNSVMSRHDRAVTWGPASLPWVEQARAYHLNAFGEPTEEQLRLAQECIDRRKPFSIRDVPRPAQPSWKKRGR